MLRILIKFNPLGIYGEKIKQSTNLFFLREIPPNW